MILPEFPVHVLVSTDAQQKTHILPKFSVHVLVCTDAHKKTHGNNEFSSFPRLLDIGSKAGAIEQPYLDEQLPQQVLR